MSSMRAAVAAGVLIAGGIFGIAIPAGASIPTEKANFNLAASSAELGQSDCAVGAGKVVCTTFDAFTAARAMNLARTDLRAFIRAGSLICEPEQNWVVNYRVNQGGSGYDGIATAKCQV